MAKAPTKAPADTALSDSDKIALIIATLKANGISLPDGLGDDKAADEE